VTTQIERYLPETTMASATAVPAPGADSDNSERLSPRRKTVLAITVVALIAAVAAVVGMVFPALLAAAIAGAVVLAVVVLDRLLGRRDLQEAPRGYWTF
jgi:Flp pilus assembly protein TadB